MYNKLKQILYLVILILAPLTNNPCSAPEPQGHWMHIWSLTLGFMGLVGMYVK